MITNDYDNLLANCLDSLKCCIELLGKYPSLQLETRDTLKQLTEEYCRENYRKEQSERALAKVAADLESVPEIDVKATYEKHLNEDSIKFVVEESPVWKEICSGSGVEEIRRQEESIPDSSYQQIDNSLAFSQVFRPPVDPITKSVIREPYRSRICGHIFDIHSFAQFVKAKRTKVKCPYVGCNVDNLQQKHLVPDPDLKMQVDRYFEENGDDSDGIE